MAAEIISPTFFHMNEWIVIKKPQSCSSFIIDIILNFMKQNAENLIGKILYMFLSSDDWPSFMEFGTNDNGRLNDIIMNEGIWYIMKSKLSRYKTTRNLRPQQ